MVPYSFVAPPCPFALAPFDAFGGDPFFRSDMRRTSDLNAFSTP